MEAIQTPIILVNFKTYIEATGKKAMLLARKAERVSHETGTCIGLAPQYTDITEITRSVDLPTFAQHVDPIDAGSSTGHILPEAVKQAGAVGTLVNHSERRIRLADIDSVIQRCRKLDLVSVVCTNNTNVSVSTATLEPSFIAIEPPELIGTGVPVSKAKPEIISDTVSRVRKVNPDVNVLCGAGITQGEDVTAALKLGTKGVLVASGVVKTKEPERVLTEFAEAIHTV
ncbi:MAG: triose-phosphate isomerase [Candidatus Bathyarchaeota archaeon]|jgi:triosephosphate isomerase|nr:MAG: triose-phosphate isomerase [Candidatus Bathyarchaeota archaeon]